MKRLTFIIISLMLTMALVGCKTKAIKLNRDTDISSVVKESDTAKVSVNDAIDWEEVYKSSTNITIEEVEYDTEKDIVEQTNTPPIKSKKTTIYKIDETKDTKADKSTNKEELSTTTIDRKDNIKEIEKIREDVNKTNPLKYIRGILWAVVTILILYLAVKMYRKFT